MKKMMIALVAFAIVTSANAATVAWTTGNMSALPSYGTMWQGQLVSFYLTTAGADLTAITTGLQNNDLTVLVGQQLDLAKALTAGPSFAAAGSTGLKSDFKQFDVAYGYAVVWNKGVFADNTLQFAISGVKASAAFGPAGSATLTFGGATNFKTYDVVPEPTSMALLALGVAALGLRRKFRK